MLKKAILATLAIASVSAPFAHAEQADNPFYKPSERNPVEAEIVDQGPQCDPEQKEAYEGKIAMLEKENNLLSLQSEETSARIAELEAELLKAKKLFSQKFIGIVNDQAIFFDEVNKVYIYKNKNEIDGELPK